MISLHNRKCVTDRKLNSLLMRTAFCRCGRSRPYFGQSYAWGKMPSVRSNRRQFTSLTLWGFNFEMNMLEKKSLFVTIFLSIALKLQTIDIWHRIFLRTVRECLESPNVFETTWLRDEDFAVLGQFCAKIIA